MHGQVQVVVADFLIADFDDIVRIRIGNSTDTETDESQCNQSQQDLGGAFVFFYSMEHVFNSDGD